MFACSNRISPKTRIIISVHDADTPPVSIAARIVYCREHHGAWAHIAEFQSVPTTKVLARISALAATMGRDEVENNVEPSMWQQMDVKQ